MGTLVKIISDSQFEKLGLTKLVMEAGWDIVSQEALDSPDEVQDTIVIASFKDASLRGQRLSGLEKSPARKVLALVTSTDQAEIWACIQHGADGVLANDVDQAVLLGALKMLQSGLRILPCELRLVGSSAAAVTEARVLAKLSPRERDVLQLVIQGLPNKVIARHLGLTEATIKVHVKAILRKLEVQNRTEAAMRAMSLGFISNTTDSEPELPALMTAA